MANSIPNRRAHGKRRRVTIGLARDLLRTKGTTKRVYSALPVLTFALPTLWKFFRRKAHEKAASSLMEFHLDRWAVSLLDEFDYHQTTIDHQ